MVIGLQTIKLPGNGWRLPSGAALAWPFDAMMDAMTNDQMVMSSASNPWLAAAVRIVSFSILVFMAFVASAP